MKSAALPLPFLCEKQRLLNQLFHKILEEKNLATQEELILAMVQNFKDDSIFPWLKELIEKKEYSAIHACAVVACGHYSLEECKKSIPFFLHQLAHADYDTAMASAQLLLHLMEIFKLEADLMDRMEKTIRQFLDPSFQKQALEKEIDKHLISSHKKQ